MACAINYIIIRHQAEHCQLIYRFLCCAVVWLPLLTRLSVHMHPIKIYLWTCLLNTAFLCFIFCLHWHRDTKTQTVNCTRIVETVNYTMRALWLATPFQTNKLNLIYRTQFVTPVSLLSCITLRYVLKPGKAIGSKCLVCLAEDKVWRHCVEM